MRVMECRIGWLVGVACACWAVCLPAQKGEGGANGTVPGVVRAEQVYRQLLAPGSRPDAMHLLWRLQGDALPVLARAVRSQDVDVVVAACAVLHDMGRVAAPVREVLAR